MDQAIYSGETQCDRCGDVSDSEPDLLCGRDLRDELGDDAGFCEGTYRNPR